MTKNAPARARRTNRSPPGTAAGAASASRGGEAAPRGRPRPQPRPRGQRRGARWPGRSSPWSRRTMTTTRRIPTACWTPTWRARWASRRSSRTSPPTSSGSSAPCCSRGSTSSPCACLAVTRVSPPSRPGSRALECGSYTPTVTSGNDEGGLSSEFPNHGFPPKWAELQQNSVTQDLSPVCHWSVIIFHWTHPVFHPTRQPTVGLRSISFQGHTAVQQLMSWFLAHDKAMKGFD